MAVLNRIFGGGGGSDGKGGGEGSNDDLGRRGAEAAGSIGKRLIRLIPKKVRIFLIVILIVAAAIALLILTVTLMIKETVSGLSSSAKASYSTNYDVEKESVENDTAVTSANSDTDRVYSWANELDPDNTERIATGVSKALSGEDGQAMIDFGAITSDGQLYISPDNLYTESENTSGILEMCRDYNRKMFAESKVSYTYHFWNWEYIPGFPTGHWEWVEYRSKGPNSVDDYGQSSPPDDGWYGDETAESVEGEEKKWLCWHSEAGRLPGANIAVGYCSRPLRENDVCPHCGASGLLSTSAKQLFGQEMGANLDLPSYVEGFTCPHCHNPYYVFTEKRFALHWQEIAAALYISGYGNHENWNNSDAEDGGFGGSFDRLGSENSVTKGYYLDDEEVQELASFFKYDTKYKYDAMNDTRRYDFTGLERSSYGVGYHFFKEDVEPPVQNSEGRHDPFYTYYIPESAPASVKNGYESVDYVYQHYNDGEMRNYYCEEGFMLSKDSYRVKGGDVILGRFDTIQPTTFITVLDKYCPYYRDSYYKGAQTATNGGSWAQNLVGQYCEALSEIDAELPGRREHNRSEFFMQLAKDYDYKVIRISYEGTKCDATMKKLEEIEKSFTGNSAYEGYKFLYAKFPEADVCNEADWTESRDEFLGGLNSSYYKVTTSLSEVPFHSYGVMHTGKSSSAGGNGGGNGGGNTNYDDIPYDGYVHLNPFRDHRDDGAFGEGWHYDIDFDCPLKKEAVVDMWTDNDNASIEQIQAMLAYFDEKEDIDTFDFVGMADVFYEWQQETGGPVSVLMAFMKCEGVFNNNIGRDKWNFFAIFTNSGWPRDFKAEYSTPKEAMKGQMSSIYTRYFINQDPPQKSAYDMFFMGYKDGYDDPYAIPLTHDEAHPEWIYHSYCPYWGSTIGMRPGQTVVTEVNTNPDNLYPNRLVIFRQQFLDLAGIEKHYGGGGFVGSSDLTFSLDPADNSKKQVELFGRTLNRSASTEPFDWCADFQTTITIPVKTVPYGEEDSTPVSREFHITVHEALAEDVAAIFEEIYNLPNFAIVVYGGEGYPEVSGFTWRTINNPDSPGSTTLSNHSFGTAIDINWVCNGFINPDGNPDSNTMMRTNDHPVVQIFRNHGWGWGGNYSGKKDYMHFSWFAGY